VAPSRARRERCRALRYWISVVRGSVGEVEVEVGGALMALEVGSRCRGSWRKVSSMFAVGCRDVCEVRNEVE